MSFSVLKAPRSSLSDVIRTAFADQATADTAVTTTTETTAITVTPAANRLPNGSSVLVMASAQLTTGTLTANVTPRLRRGTGTGGVVIGEANAVSVSSAAGGTDVYSLMAIDTTIIHDQGYSFTLQQGSATADGSIIYASMAIIVLATF